MRQHVFLRWIEQAEARRFADAVSYDYAVVVSAERGRKGEEVAIESPPSRLRLLWLRRRSFRVVDNLC